MWKRRRNLIGSSIEREVSRLKYVNIGLRHVPTVSFWVRDLERGVIFTPEYQLFETAAFLASTLAILGRCMR